MSLKKLTRKLVYENQESRKHTKINDIDSLAQQLGKWNYNTFINWLKIDSLGFQPLLTQSESCGNLDIKKEIELYYSLISCKDENVSICIT